MSGIVADQSRLWRGYSRVAGARRGARWRVASGEWREARGERRVASGDPRQMTPQSVVHHQPRSIPTAGCLPSCLARSSKNAPQTDPPIRCRGTAHHRLWPGTWWPTTRPSEERHRVQSRIRKSPCAGPGTRDQDQVADRTGGGSMKGCANRRMSCTCLRSVVGFTSHQARFVGLPPDRPDRSGSR
jgi:hypothetical protein